MNLSGAESMGRETPNSPVKSLGEAFRAALKRAFPNDTVKTAANQWGLDLKTAKNAAEGLAGAAVVSKAVKAQQAQGADAWELWLEMGRSLIGESLDEYEERKLRQLIEITENAKRMAQARHEQCRARRKRLEDGARALADMGSRLAS